VAKSSTTTTTFFDFQAPETGVYTRLRSESSGATNYRWMYFCKSDDLADVLAHRLRTAGAMKRSLLGDDAGSQAYQWAAAQRALASAFRPTLITGSGGLSW
jgi:hypothetical protein